MAARAFEIFARNFLRRVDAQFSADGDFAGGVVAHIGRIEITLSCVARAARLCMVNKSMIGAHANPAVVPSPVTQGWIEITGAGTSVGGDPLQVHDV